MNDNAITSQPIILKKSVIYHLTLIVLLLGQTAIHAQDGEDDSLLDLLEDIEAEEAPVIADDRPALVLGTFGGTHLINGESIETVNKRVWSFIISHRFGALNTGWRDIFGLDQASVRFAMEYGILDNLTVGFGRGTFEKTWDFYTKYRFLEQREKGMPFSVAYFGSISMSSLEPVSDADPNYFSSRVAYANQLLIARKFNDWVSLQIMPTVVHQNLVETPEDPNTLFLIGIGGKVKIHKMMAFLVEYYPRIKDNPDSIYKDAFAVGIDLVTGGHVFQFHFTNANAMYTAGFARKTTDNFWKGDIHFGFNISRTFGMNGKLKEKKAAKKATLSNE
jgi:hypothetical protein